MKLLTLVVYSEDLAVHKEHLKAWRLYSKHNSSCHVYFIISSTAYTKTTLVEDILYVPGEENFETMPYKFIAALDFFDYKSYDFILRTNMSSFWVFHNLFPVLEQLPKENVLAGEVWGNFVSGAGMLFTPDVCEILVYNRIGLSNFKSLAGDDIRISQYLNFFHEIPYTQLYPKRYDIEFPENGTEEKIPSDIFHFRVKHVPEKRYLEYGIMSNLYKRFYNSNVLPSEPSSSQS